MSSRKRANQFRPDDIIKSADIFEIKRESLCMTRDALVKALHTAFQQGEESVRAQVKNPPRAYSAQKLYADRYAALRDLVSHGIDRKPIAISQTMDGMKVSLLQGDHLDQFVDRHLASIPERTGN